MRQFAIPQISKPACFATVIAAHFPLLFLQFRRLWQNENYQFFPFVVGVFGVLLWQRWPHEADCRVGRSAGKLLVSFGWGLLAASILLWSRWLVVIALICNAAGALLFVVGRRSFFRLFPIWLLLWLLVSLPGQLETSLVFSLQTITSRTASYLLDCLGVNHFLSGHILEVPGQEFLTEEACSGIRSLLTLNAFALMFLVAFEKKSTYFLPIILLTAFWSCVLNTVRVAAVVFASVQFNIDLLDGWRHRLLGLFLFVMAMWMVASTLRLLEFLFQGVPSDAEWDGESHEPQSEGSFESGPVVVNDSPDSNRWLVSWLVCFSVLGLLQLMALGLRIENALAERVINFDKETLQSSILGVPIVDFERKKYNYTNIWGQHEARWTYESEQATIVVAINYPMLGWHPLTNCYASLGWSIEGIHKVSLIGADEEITVGASPDVSTNDVKVSHDSLITNECRTTNESGNACPVHLASDKPIDEIPVGGQFRSVVCARLEKPDGERARLLYACFDQSGNPLKQTPAWGFSTKLMHGLTKLGFDQSSYQIQLLVTPKNEFGNYSDHQMQNAYRACAQRLLPILRKIDTCDTSTNRVARMTPQPLSRSVNQITRN